MAEFAANEPARILEVLTASDLHGRVWEMEAVACPLCGEPQSHPKYAWDSPYPAVPMRFTVAVCSACSFLFTNPRLSESALAAYYARESPYSTQSYHCLPQVRERYVGMVKAMSECGLRGGSSILEIGTDKGQFLVVARERGFEVKGIEISSGADIAREKFGLDVERVSIQQAKLPVGAYDAIVMLDVLEHLHKPIGCLQMIEHALSDHGLLLVKVPNVRHEHGLYPLLRGQAALRFGAHEHLLHFTKFTLEHCLQRVGLQPLVWIGFQPLPRQSACGRLAQKLVCSIAGLYARLNRNWADWNVSLVCIAGRSVAKMEAENESCQ